ncbi:MAG TPA: RNA polymerase subunit sigma-70 [Polyangiaceae bacterium]|nr:RNA polymerase subunit sigma-70 [Polyangiaceae bacterium]
MDARASEESFRTLFEPYRRAMTLHCYRMLGSLQDAEEVVQEALLRGWQRRDEIRSIDATRAWLYKIATNACLDLLKVRRRRALPHLVAPPARPGAPFGPPADEMHWVEPAPDALLDVADDAVLRPDARVSLRESIGLAFITALQLLPPKQRAALLLVDVLGWKPQESAALLETSVFSLNSLLQRARSNIEARREHDGPREAPSADDAALLRRYITAWESGDLDAFTTLLADDAILSMPPQPEWYAGRDAIRAFLANVLEREPREYRAVPVAANAGLAVAIYRREAMSKRAFEAAAITFLTLRGGRVSRMVRFSSPKVVALFGLPVELGAGET